MAIPPKDSMDERLRRAIASDSDRRLQRFIEGANAISQLRETHVIALQREAESDEWLKGHLAVASDVVQRWGKGLQEQADGIRTGDEVWKELRPLWQQAFSTESEERLAAAFSRADVHSAEVEKLLLAAALDAPVGSIPRWTAGRTLLGTMYVEVPPAPTPPAPTPPAGDVGTVRQGLDDAPMRQDVCVRRPFSATDPVESRDGLAVITNLGGVSFDSATGFVDSSTFAPLLAAGGGSITMTVGSQVSWRRGHRRLTIDSATQFSVAMRAVTFLAGATASCELVMFVVLSDGREFVQTSFIGAATAPLLWFSESIVNAARTISIDDIPLNGDAGSATIRVGIRAFSAAVGIGGSSAARAGANFFVDTICTNVR